MAPKVDQDGATRVPVRHPRCAESGRGREPAEGLPHLPSVAGVPHPAVRGRRIDPLPVGVDRECADPPRDPGSARGLAVEHEVRSDRHPQVAATRRRSCRALGACEFARPGFRRASWAALRVEVGATRGQEAQATAQGRRRAGRRAPAGSRTSHGVPPSGVRGAGCREPACWAPEPPAPSPRAARPGVAGQQGGLRRGQDRVVAPGGGRVAPPEVLVARRTPTPSAAGPAGPGRRSVSTSTGPVRSDGAIAGRPGPTQSRASWRCLRGSSAGGQVGAARPGASGSSA